MGISGGWQDQYATVFGGFNFMEFSNRQNLIHPLRLSETTKCSLEQNLILCYTNTSHKSSEIHQDQKSNLDNKDAVSFAVKPSPNINIFCLKKEYLFCWI